MRTRVRTLFNDPVSSNHKIVQSYSLNVLAKQGLRKKHFKDCDWFNTYTHVQALNYLVMVSNLPIENALIKLKLLNDVQLEKIGSGFSIEEIEQLTTREQYTFLSKYKSQGMTADDFTNKKWFNSLSHLKAAENLIQNNLSPQTAILELEGLREDQIAVLKSGRYRRTDLEGLNEFQVKALYDFFINYNFKAENFRGQDWLDDAKILDKLKALTLQFHQKLSPAEILNQLHTHIKEKIDKNENTQASYSPKLYLHPQHVEGKPEEHSPSPRPCS